MLIFTANVFTVTGAVSTLIADTQAMAPILPHMAEDIWQTLPFTVQEKSIFQVKLLLTASQFETNNYYCCCDASVQNHGLH
jgi:isoleucyl-tRNA synthetase